MIVRATFREQALAGQTQRERIDHLLKVTAPSERIVTMAFGVLTVALLVWLIFGAVPHTISTEGVVVETPPPRAVVSDTGGRLAAWLVAPGDRIEAGAPVARLAFPELDARVAVLRKRVKAMQDTVGEGSDGGSMQALALAAARMALVELEADRIVNGVVVSPAAGEVADLGPAPGDRVAAGAPIASVRAAGGHGLQLMVRVADDMAREVGPGTPAAVTTTRPEGTRRSFPAEVADVPELAPAPDRSAPGPNGGTGRLWQVRLSVDGDGGRRLAHGTRVRVRFFLEPQSPAALLGLVRG